MMPQGYLFPYIECLRPVRPAYVNYSDGTPTIHQSEIESFHTLQTKYSQSFWSIAWAFRISHFRVQNFFLGMLSNDTDRQMIIYGHPFSSKQIPKTKLLCWNPIRSYHSKPVMKNYPNLTWNEKEYVQLLNEVESSLKTMKRQISNMIILEFQKFLRLLFFYFMILIGFISSRSISNFLLVINGLIKINLYRRKEYDIFLSHEWGRHRKNIHHNFVRTIESFLYWIPVVKSFLDEYNLYGEMTPQLRRAINDSEIFIIFLTISYNYKLFTDDNFCYKEFKEAQSKRKKIVLVILDEKMKDKGLWESSLVKACGDLKYLDMTRCENLDLMQYLYRLYLLVNDIVKLYHDRPHHE
eukprot:gene8831-9566_t